MLYDIDNLKLEFVQTLYNNLDDISTIFSTHVGEHYIETELTNVIMNDPKYSMYIINCSIYDDFMDVKRIKFSLIVNEKMDVLDCFDLHNVRMHNSFNFEYLFLQNYFAYAVRNKKLEELLKMI